jgi:hypothetical protein
MQKDGRTWKLKRNSFLETEIDEEAWLLDRSHRNDTEEVDA